MSTLASCPRCARQVTIPRGAESSDMVRCPLCSAEYSLEEALATAPPTLVVISGLAIVEPEHSTEHESALHLFPAADSALHIAGGDAGSSGLDLGDTEQHAGDDHSEHHDLHAHSEPVSERPSDEFTSADLSDPELSASDLFGSESHGSESHGSESHGSESHGGEAEGLELPSHDLTDATPAADAQSSGSPWSSDELALSDLPADAADDTNLETERGDFLASFEDSEPPAGAAAGEMPTTADVLAANASSFDLDSASHDSASHDMGGHDLGGLDLSGHEAAGLPPHMPGDALAEHGTDEISFDDADDESFSLADGEPEFDTVNLDSGFEEVRPIPEDTEGYALDHEAPAEETVEEELAGTAASAPREARRKPSMITVVVMNLIGLCIALPFAYAFVFYYAKMDPLHVAGILPDSMVPSALSTKKLAAAIPPSAINQPVAGLPNDPGADPSQPDSQPVAGASGADPAAGNAPGDSGDGLFGAGDADDDNKADDPAMAADNPLGGDAPADTDADADSDPAAAGASVAGDANDADMPAEDATATDTDADTDDPAAMAADSDPDAMPADAGDTEVAESADPNAADADDDMPADAPAEGALDIIVVDPDEPADADDMPADPAADSDPADASESAATDKDADNDDDVKTPAAKDPAADDDAGVNAALDAAMVDDDTDQPATAVGPRDSVEYTPADVDQALTDLGSAIKGMDLAAKADQKKFKAQYYRKLYQLAEVATFTPSMAVGPKAEEGSQQAVVYETLTGSAATPRKFEEVGKAAAVWLSAVKGKEHQGIVLSGTLESTHASGGVFESRVLLTDGKSAVTVLSPVAPNAGRLSGVLVWGSVVDNPTHNIAGYEGDAATIVWATAVEQAPAGAGWKPAATGSR